MAAQVNKEVKCVECGAATTTPVTCTKCRGTYCDYCMSDEYLAYVMHESTPANVALPPTVGNLCLYCREGTPHWEAVVNRKWSP